MCYVAQDLSSLNGTHHTKPDSDLINPCDTHPYMDRSGCQLKSCSHYRSIIIEL